MTMDDQIPQTIPRSRVKTSALDLSAVPPISVLASHFKGNEVQEVEETLREYKAPLTPDPLNVNVFIGKVGTKRRAEFELRSRKLKVEDLSESKRAASPVKVHEPRSKRRKLAGTASQPTSMEDQTTEEEVMDDSQTEDEATTIELDTPTTSPTEPPASPPTFETPPGTDIIWVIKLEWLYECIDAGRLLPLGEHLVFKGKVIERPVPAKPMHEAREGSFQSPSALSPKKTLESRADVGKTILDRAKSDVTGTSPKSTYQPHRPGGSSRFEDRSFAPRSRKAGRIEAHTARLPQKTTSEDEKDDSDIPPPPKWVTTGLKYSCQRFTPANGPNEEFIAQLKHIRTARILIDDEIGVRAYSTIIASIAAYPYKLMHPRELLQLPGCDEKTCTLFIEWKNTNMVEAVEEYMNDGAMKVLRLFYDIWGVGAKTARHFYYSNHWTELDDIIEFGWSGLDRVQQIGVKYYDEFLDPIPRPEVEQIARVVRDHAIRVRDERITATIVGGYRRGKAASGDVDIIISHPDFEATAGLVKDLVEALEETKWITHTLTMNLKNTNRGQSTLPFRSSKLAGAGHDTLDKALVVWQNPSWSTCEQEPEDPGTRNPNIHRRVDIIVAPWRTVGCAVMGWSGGTTFQRDLRRYAKYVKGWKFDSSGVRSRSTGEVVQLEGPNGIDGTPEDAEKKVFEGLGLEYVPPEYRCTY